MKAYLSIRRVLCGLLALGCICLAGCGGKAEENVSGSEALSGEAEAVGGQKGTSENKVSVKDLQSSREIIFSHSDGYAMGLQFYQGDVIQFRMVDKTQYAWNDGVPEAISGHMADIYLDRADGSSELLVEDMPDAEMAEWYMAQDGCIYCIKKDYEKTRLPSKSGTGREMCYMM